MNDNDDNYDKILVREIIKRILVMRTSLRSYEKKADKNK